MFKNFNHQFVYKYPLLWNTKMIPFALIALVIHVVFFALGYQNAIVSSVQIHSYYNQESNAVTINLFAILLSVLAFVIWCFLYFRNNAFKAFYPKTNYALFQEWSLIVLFCLLNFSFALSAVLGANAQTRNSMPQQLAFERCETLSKASMFLQGSYKEQNWTDSISNQEVFRVERDSFPFEGKKYALTSLLNKNVNSFPFFDEQKDSLMRLQVQRWLKENNKAEIASVFEKYFAIATEHQLKANISAETWLELVYDFPEFTKYANIGKSEREPQYEYDNINSPIVNEDGEVIAIDTVSTTIREEDGQSYVYSKYYVSDNALHKYYESIATAWENPLLDFNFLILVLYLSVGSSLMVFSFKVTAAKQWLIALISIGVIQLVFAILAVIISYNMTFPILFVLYFILVCLYFATIFKQKRGKKWSAIALNQLLWLLPAFLPMTFFIVIEYAKQASGYYNRYNERTVFEIERFPKIEWFEENTLLLYGINVAIVAFVLFVLSAVIKKWRGIPEE